MRRPLALASLLICLAVTPGAAAAYGPVTLQGWEPGARLTGGVRGSYRMTARVVWSPDAPRQGSYTVRVSTPGGQVSTHAIDPRETPGSRRLTVYVPAEAVRNLRPEQVLVRVEVVDAATGAASDPLEATIADFPTPDPGNPPGESRPFGWGRPLATADGQGAPLPRPGPDGLRFVRVPGEAGASGFYLAATEVSNQQAGLRLEGFDPRAGRSDEFLLEDPAQPAPGLTPSRANAYLEALSKADPAGVAFRLPTRDEWVRAERAGSSAPFWWGDAATHPEGANLIGPEPSLEADTTAPADPPARGPRFEANPWGLFHTVGNLEEWATGPGGGFVRLGGHFRSEPSAELPEAEVADPETTGADPYVGLRPAFDLTAEAGAGLIRKALASDARLAGLEATFDPDRATATLTGVVADASARREADRRLGGLWFLAAVENRVESPTVAPGQLARIAGVAGPAQRIRNLGRWMHRVPVAVRWADQLPALGSDWYVNLYLPNGGHVAHPLVERQPGPGRRVTAVVEERVLGNPEVTAASIALSLGRPAPTIGDPAIVSDVAPIRWSVAQAP